MFTQERNAPRNLTPAQAPGAIYFVTYRLAGSIPPALLQRLRAAQEKWLRRFAVRGTNPVERLPRASKLLFGRLDDHLDQPGSRNWLARPEIAALVRDSLRRHDGRRYQLLAYCIMPNHVHALVRLSESAPPEEDSGALGEQRDTVGPMARIMRAWKNSTTPKVSELVGEPDSVWHPESYVHLVRDDEELQRFIDYIAYNPVKAGLARQVHEWPWCSAHDRFHSDGRETAWLPIRS